MIQFLLANACFLTRFFAGRGDVFLLHLISRIMEWTRPCIKTVACWNNDRDHRDQLTCQCWKHLAYSDSLEVKHSQYIPHQPTWWKANLVIHPHPTPVKSETPKISKNKGYIAVIAINFFQAMEYVLATRLHKMPPLVFCFFNSKLTGRNSISWRENSMVFSVVNRQFLAHEEVTRGCEASNLGERYL